MCRYILLFCIILLSIKAKPNCVIVNNQCDVQNINKQFIQKIFMKKLYFIGKQKAVPVNLLATDELRIAFETNVLGLRRERVNQYWVKRHFLGESPPLTQASPASVKLFVKNVDCAIGYIPKSMVDNSVKVLYEF